jgi:hypothetical protein
MSDKSVVGSISIAGGLILFIILLLICALIASFSVYLSLADDRPNVEIAAIETNNAMIVAQNARVTETIMAMQLTASASTPIHSPDSPPTETPTLAGGLFVRLTSLEDGAEVRPRETVIGDFLLEENASIHVLVQPSSQDSLWFPVADFYQVLEGQNSGRWSVAVKFGEGAALVGPEQYRLQVVVAEDDQARELLDGAVETGLQEIPGELAIYTPVITVARPASQEN